MTIFRIDGIEIHFPLQIRIGNILRNRKSKAELSVAHGVIPYKNRIRIVGEGESRSVILIVIIQAGDSHFAVFHCRIYDTGKIGCQLSGSIQHLTFDPDLLQSFERDRGFLYRQSIYRRHFHSIFRISQFDSRISDQTKPHLHSVCVIAFRRD